MAQVQLGGAHGCYKLIAQLVGADGISYGVAGDSLSAGSISNAYVMDFPVSANVTIPDRTVIDFTGGDVWQQSYLYGITAFQSFEFQLEDTDPLMTALCTGGLVDQTSNAQWTEYSENILAPTLPQMSLIIIHRIQSFDAATFGTTKFVNTIIPRCWISPKGVAGVNFQAKSASVFQVQPTGASRKINGELFGVNIQQANNRVAMYHVITDNPLYMTTMIASGATATLVSSEQPVSSAVGTTSSSKSRINKIHAGAATVGVADTITPSTGTFAIGTAITPAANDVLTALFETQFLAA